MRKQLIFILLVFSLLALTPSKILSTHESAYILTYKANITQNNIDELKALNAHIIYQYQIIPAIALLADQKALDLLKIKDEIENIELQDTYTISNPAKQKINISKENKTILCVVDTDIKDAAQALPPISLKKDFVLPYSQQSFHNNHAEEITNKIIEPLDISKTGIVPGNFNLISATACDDLGFCNTAQILAAIDWCIENTANIISVSLGGGQNQTTLDSPAISKAINNLLEQNITVITAG